MVTLINSIQFNSFINLRDALYKTYNSAVQKKKIAEQLQYNKYFSQI